MHRGCGRASWDDLSKRGLERVLEATTWGSGTWSSRTKGRLGTSEVECGDRCGVTWSGGCDRLRWCTR